MNWQRLGIASIILLTIAATATVQAQRLSAGRLGLGFNLGGQKIYCETDGGVGFGMEAYAKYKLNPQFFSTLALGYGELNDSPTLFGQSNFATDLITLDIKGGANLLTQGNFVPYAHVGIGLFYFNYNGPNDNALPGRFLGGYGDAFFFFGGGFEARINPMLAFDAYVDYRMTTGDDLNNIKEGANDSYLNFRAGITYYLAPTFGGGSSSDVELSEKSPLDEIGGEGNQYSPDDELNALVEGLDNYNEASNANMAMEEYIKLKSRVDQLSDAIRQKELEIEELKTQLAVRKEKIAQLENNLRQRGGSLESSLNADLSDFAASYEQALQHYYAHEFEAAIYLFNSLLETSPTHKLASNCQYWLGECYFGQGDYSQAVGAFQRVMAYDQSFKRDDALLMMGRSYIKLDQKELAKQMFDQLMSEFPDSEYFQKAQQYAAGIR